MGKIVTLTKENFDEVTGAGTVVVDFWAPWCAPCRAFSPVLDEVAEETDATVAKCNVDEQPDLAERFGVSVIPTVAVLEGGKEKARSVGLVPKEKILALLG